MTEFASADRPNHQVIPANAGLWLSASAENRGSRFRWNDPVRNGTAFF